MIQKIDESAKTKGLTLFTRLEQHLLEDEIPSAGIGRLSALPEFEDYPFSMLDRLKTTKQSPKHHPEGSAWNHTLLVVDEAAKLKNDSRNPRAFMWAALLHDIGKPDTTRIRNGRITAYAHDTVGARLAGEFLSVFCDDEQLAEQVTHLVRYHMQILYVVHDLPFQDIDAMNRDTDIREVALLGLCDRFGRGGAQRQEEEDQVKLFLKQCQKKG